MTSNLVNSREGTPSSALRTGRTSDMLVDIIVVLSVILASYLIYVSIAKGPTTYLSPGFLLIMTFLFAGAAGGILIGRQRSLIMEDDGFVLMQRRMFRTSYRRDRIRPASIIKVTFRPLPRWLGIEKPLLRIELAGGRRLRFSHTQLGEETYNALAQMASPRSSV